MSRQPPLTLQLCSACGLCCNGVLFGDVELQRGEAPERLIQLGLRLRRKGQKTVLPQPCACFDGALCRIYENRPDRCRSFACRLLLRTEAGEIAPARALERIQQTLQHVKKVRRLLIDCGNEDESRPLMKRYTNVLAEPTDLAGSAKHSRSRGRLLLAMHDLMQVLHREFLR